MDLGYYCDMNTHMLSQTHMLKHNPQGNRHENVGSMGGAGHEDPSLMNGVITLKKVLRENPRAAMPKEQGLSRDESDSTWSLGF